MKHLFISIALFISYIMVTNIANDESDILKTKDSLNTQVTPSKNKVLLSKSNKTIVSKGIKKTKALNHCNDFHFGYNKKSFIVLILATMVFGLPLFILYTFFFIHKKDTENDIYHI